MVINPGMLLGMIKQQDKRLKILEDKIADKEDYTVEYIPNGEGSWSPRLISKEIYNQEQVRGTNSRTPEESQG